MKSVSKKLLAFGILGLFYSVSLKAQVIENNSSAPLNFSVVVGCADNSACTSQGTYQFSLAPHTARILGDGVILSSTVTDGSAGYTVKPGDNITVPLYGGLKDIQCTTFKKVIWDHEQL